jgi:hypothetical protein
VWSEQKQKQSNQRHPGKMQHQQQQQQQHQQHQQQQQQQQQQQKQMKTSGALSEKQSNQQQLGKCQMENDSVYFSTNYSDGMYQVVCLFESRETQLADKPPISFRVTFTQPCHNALCDALGMP